MSGSFDPIEDALAAVIRSASSPAVQEAQALLLRRLALEGGVIPSRIPPPRNITEVGGYLNLLAAADMGELRRSALAAALGLASPASVTWDEAPPTPGWANLPNDLTGAPPGAALAVPLRADLAAAWRAGVAPALAALGARLRLWSKMPRLPDAGEDPASADLLALLGRVVWIDPTSALEAPETDDVLLGRADTDAEGTLRVVLRASGPSAPPPAAFTALVWDEVANTLVSRPIGSVAVADIGPLVGLAGFRAAKPVVPPQSRFDLRWARLESHAGLLPGISRLGDELRTLWTPREIARSALATRTGELWTGTGFAPGA
jgi:hypothetical protein